MSAPAWPLPEALEKADGRPRRVGVEFELRGIDVDTLSRLTAQCVGGTVEPRSRAEHAIVSGAFGDWRVEVDFALLKRLARREDGEAEKGSDLGRLAVDALEAASSLVVPCEVVTPPIPMEALAETLEPLTGRLRDAGAEGTLAAPHHAFGLHLNVEPPDLEAKTLVRYLKAFVCLFDWIAWRGQVDFARRVTPYIDRFPEDYERRVADPAYRPRLEELVADYLEANATRNRALDMLPLLAHLDEDAVRAAVDDPRVNARPAFHYRLANCEIDDENWSIAHPWARWVQVERLAADPHRLDTCCRAFLADRDRLTRRFDNAWREHLDTWLNEDA